MEPKKKMKLAADEEDETKLAAEEKARVQARYDQLCKEIKKMHSEHEDGPFIGGLHAMIEHYEHLGFELDRLNEALYDVIQKMKDFGMDAKEGSKLLY